MMIGAIFHMFPITMYVLSCVAAKKLSCVRKVATYSVTAPISSSASTSSSSVLVSSRFCQVIGLSLTLSPSCCSSRFVLLSPTCEIKELIACRIPNSSPGLSIRIFLVLVRWTWCLYVFPLLSFAWTNLTNWCGTVYIFAGSLLLESWVVNYIFGSIIGFVGIGYVALEFVPSIEPPQNMREADGGWGAEQV